MYKVHCIKCRIEYMDEDPDPFYCPECVIAKNKIAAEIDAKLKSQPRKESVSGIKQFDSLPKVRGFVDARYLI